MNLLSHKISNVISAMLTLGTYVLVDNAALAVNPKTGTSYPNASSPLGINLAGITYYSTELPFLDAFKSSSPWIPQCRKEDPDCTNSWSTKENKLLDLDRYGWVKSLPAPEDSPIYTRVSTLLFRDMKDRYPSGKYVVLYDGEGTIEYGLAAKKVKSTPGRDTIQVNSRQNSGVLISITSTDPKKNGNYIRNIRVVKAEQEKLLASQTFNPKFLEKIQKFKAIRFMDWMKTNKSKQQNWSERILPETASYDNKGVPIEVMVSLSNRLKADPWFNMPHMANDEYIANFAKQVKSTLDPQLKIYVEYSNEVWNRQFPQYKWVAQQAAKQWPASENKGNDYTQVANWHGKRTAQICNIWKQAFGDRSDRIVCVLGIQAASEWQANQALDCPLWKEKPCYQQGIDAIAIAPYFGGGLGSPKNESQVEKWTLDQLFEELKQGGVLSGSKPKSAADKSFDSMKRNFKLAEKRNLRMLAYEGGQHLVGVKKVVGNQAITDLFTTANKDPRMYDLYTDYLNKWKSSGGELFMQFSSVGQYGKWGSWGALEYIDQKDSPKYKALIDFQNNNPCWWEGCGKDVTDSRRSEQTSNAGDLNIKGIDRIALQAISGATGSEWAEIT
ncbi:MAG: cellulose-binding protein [Cyanosarcina radialis HA8281-LM2]|jgi:hypothetical protein|nr:cellulose-binding protein [Cyanosarcina radialis HA8281-LM2]